MPAGAQSSRAPRLVTPLGGSARRRALLLSSRAGEGQDPGAARLSGPGRAGAGPHPGTAGPRPIPRAATTRPRPAADPGARRDVPGRGATSRGVPAWTGPAGRAVARPSASRPGRRCDEARGGRRVGRARVARKARDRPAADPVRPRPPRDSGSFPGPGRCGRGPRVPFAATDFFGDYYYFPALRATEDTKNAGISTSWSCDRAPLEGGRVVARSSV